MPLPITKAVHFGTYLVTSQVFHITPTTFALVNLKPLLPGHILICPLRPVPRLRDLTPTETTDLFLTVQRVSRMLERVFKASAFNVAIQDGVDAGQSVAHVHAHVIPRTKGDLGGEVDEVYRLMEGEEGDVGRHLRERDGEGERERGRFPAVDEGSRRPRSEEEMRAEAEWLAREMEKEEELA